MNLLGIPLFSTLTEKMNWLGERQNKIAKNIANADTPGYRPVDLTPIDFKSVLAHQHKAPTGLAATQAQHLGGKSDKSAYKTVNAPLTEASLDQNGVNLEQEMAKLGETTTDYRLLTQLFKKHIQMIQAVLSSRS